MKGLLDSAISGFGDAAPPEKSPSQKFCLHTSDVYIYILFGGGHPNIHGFHLLMCKRIVSDKFPNSIDFGTSSSVGDVEGGLHSDSLPRISNDVPSTRDRIILASHEEGR